jgi:hypothetical protein
MVLRAGDTVPEGAPRELVLSRGMSRFMELDLEGGAVLIPLPGDGPRLRACGCRMRRSPERPSPCSPGCSGIIGDLYRSKSQRLSLPWVPETLCRQPPQRRPCSIRIRDFVPTYLDMFENSIAVFASKEYLVLALVSKLKVGA